MEIKVGDYEVLETGTVLGNINESVDFILDNKTDFILRMDFQEDPSKQDPAVKAELFGKNGLKILFTNFSDPLGNGNVSPIKLGETKGRELFINYRISSQDNTGKLIHYTFLLGKEVKDGK